MFAVIYSITVIWFIGFEVLGFLKSVHIMVEPIVDNVMYMCQCLQCISSVTKRVQAEMAVKLGQNSCKLETIVNAGELNLGFCCYLFLYSPDDNLITYFTS